MGLGKTIETVALILCNPRLTVPGSRVGQQTSALTIEQEEQQAVRLAGDHEDANNIDLTGSGSGSGSSGSSGAGVGAGTLHPKPKPKWNGGTLVVCMVSLVGQWIDEIKNKLTADSACSVYSYHGSSRKKDPSLLSKYDVVVTTYSILAREMDDAKKLAATQAAKADWQCK